MLHTYIHRSETHQPNPPPIPPLYKSQQFTSRLPWKQAQRGPSSSSSSVDPPLSECLCSPASNLHPLPSPPRRQLPPASSLLPHPHSQSVSHAHTQKPKYAHTRSILHACDTCAKYSFFFFFTDSHDKKMLTRDKCRLDSNVHSC